MKTKGKRNNQLNVITLSSDQLATEAALDSTAFSKLHVKEAIPKTWEDRAKKAWEYYTEEPVIANIIDTWKAFSLGDELKITCDDEDVKKEATELSEKLNLHKLVSDALVQIMVKGCGYVYKRYNKAGDDIEQVFSLNPITIKAKYVQGELESVKQYSDENSVGTSDAIQLPIEQLIHLKWRSPEWASQGNSMILPAFQCIELLRDYRKAQQALAKRWTTPLRLIKVGGQYGQKIIMPDKKMLDSVRGLFNKMDLRSGMVVPFFVDVSTYGAQGEALSVQKDVQDVKEDIMVALGMSRAIVSAEGPNFATASIAFRKILITLSEIKQYVKQILRWIFDDWQEMKGYQEKSIQFILPELDMNNELDVKKILLELYDRRLISENSLQMKMDLKPEIESSQQDEERKKPLFIPDAKTIVEMVNAGIMSVETARSKLGLDGKAEKTNISQADTEGTDHLYMNALGAFSEDEELLRTMAAKGLFDKSKILKTLDKGEYEIRTLLVDQREYGGPNAKPIEMRVCFSKFDGSFMGGVEIGKFIKNLNITKIQLAKPDHKTASIGFIEDDQRNGGGLRWVGWSHRAHCSFGIGDKLFKEEEYAGMSSRTPFIKGGLADIENLDQAKQAAVNFAGYVS